MTEKESAIHEGLKSIAPETAAFFKTGIEIYNTETDARAYMLAHVSREIESGLRDVLCIKNDIVEKCPTCKQSTTKRLGHQESILKALGLDTQNDFAKRWYDTAKNFHRYAHRHGAWKTAREKDAFDKLWKIFVEILHSLVGSYLSIADRTDTIISNLIPSEEILNSLPNLLNTESRCVYFFKHLKQIGWLPLLYNKGYFAGNKNPKPIETEMKDGNMGYSIPRWEVLDYLIYSAKTLAEQPGADLSIITKIMDEICQYRTPDGEKILNAHTDDAIITLITYLPTERIKTIYWGYIREILTNPFNHANYTFERLVQRFIEQHDKDSLLQCLELILSYVKVDNQVERYYPAIEGYFLSHLFEEYKLNIIEICCWDGLSLAITKMDEISSEEHFFGVNAVEDHPQNWNKYEYALQLIYFIRDCLINEQNLPKLTLLLKKMICDKREIYRRIAFYVISVHYEKLKEILWKIDFNPLDNLANKHELFELFKEKSLFFDKEQINKVLSWIESITFQIRINEPNYEPLLFGERKEWLISLSELDDRDVKEMVIKYNAISPYNFEHPGFNSWVSSHYGVESPVTLEELDAKNTSEVIGLFHKYDSLKAEYPFDFEIEGLSHAIQEDIKSNINKYIYDTDNIIAAPIYFQYSWVQGLSEYCHTNKKTFYSWECFSTIHCILLSSYFWDKHNEKDGMNHHRWFVSGVLSLIIESIKNKPIQFETQAHPFIKEILLKILHNEKTIVDDYSDLSYLHLNSVKGKLYQALVYFMLSRKVWDAEIKIVIEGCINQKGKNPLLYYSLGNFFQSFYQHNKDWAVANINRIFPLNEKENWKAAMNAYHLYNNRIYKELFFILKDNLHYNHFITDVDSFSTTSTLMIISHILVVYNLSTGGFDVTDKLMGDIIQSDNPNIYHSIVQFHSRHLSRDDSEKVRILWRKLFAITKAGDTDAKKLFLQESYRLLDYFDSLDKEMGVWLTFACQYIESFAHSRHFLEAISPYVKTSPEIVGNIALKVVAEKENASSSKLKDIVEALYISKFNDLSDKICNACAERGNDELRPLYNKYHKA